ncbi:DNA cytosine methyltransferase [Endobacterium cereale]|uniref:DNA cytosine methyltransferase n=1 Tax=Endobacterium cereale TaxID=2663029 RepID=UPI002B47F25C|nr:DNA cytosine methyltransferase [Endobacterium cereale]MEB2845976.1 DNA cytosine methyltransferase [Endobacterium cereale]
MAKKQGKKGDPLRRPLEQAFRGRAISDHRPQGTNAYLALAHYVDTLRATGRNEHEISFILARDGFTGESTRSLQAISRLLSESDRKVLKEGSTSQSAIDALLQVDPDVRSVALGRIATGAVLGAPGIYLVADELHRSSLPHNEQHSLDLHRQVSEQTARLTAAGHHPFQNELLALLTLCDEYENLLHIREVEFEELKAMGLTHATGPLSSDRQLGSVKRRAEKVLDGFDDLFEWSEAARATWAHLELIDPHASLLAQARYALGQIAEGNLSVLERPWSVHFPRTGGEALNYLLERPSAKTTNRNDKTRPARILNAAVIGTGTLGIALGLEAAGYAIRSIFEDDAAARANIRSRRSDWRVQRGGVDGNDALYRQIKRSVAKEDLHLLAGKLNKAAWKVRPERCDRDPEVIRVNELLAKLAPDTFFFELPPKSGALDVMAYEIDQLGYETSEFALTLTDFNIPQSRSRIVFCGIKRNFGRRINPPVVESQKLSCFSYLEEALRVGGNSHAMTSWRKAYLKKEEEEEQERNRKGKKEQEMNGMDNLHYPSVPDLETLREENHARTREGWNNLCLSNRLYSLLPIAPPNDERMLPLSMPMLKRLQGIPGKWALSGSIKDQLNQIIETVPPIIARMVGHQMHAALSNQYVNIQAAFEEKIAIRNDKAGSTGGGHQAFEDSLKRAELYEREVLAQEQEIERMAEEARLGSRSRPGKAPPPPPPRVPRI